MTICATNFTFCDFILNPLPSVSFTAHLRDIGDFGSSHVVEFQHANIALAAIDAALVVKVLAQPLRVQSSSVLLITVTSYVVR
jgi:hypothetical protein